MSENKRNALPLVSDDEMQRQQAFAKKTKEIVCSRYPAPKALVRTFGCQQNVADAQRIKGMLAEMGYGFTDEETDADLILFNTCAVREHAEDRVIGNVGALKHFKRRRPDAIVALCGCMMQQQHVADRIRKSFSHVDLVFGTHVIHQLPELLYNTLTRQKRVFAIPDSDGVIAEGIPFVHDGGVRGWLPVMYGCNNFCTYCIVPYVRGRERSRTPEAIKADLKKMLSQGIKDITLLGQNVNSYAGGMTFAQLLRELNAVDGQFTLRFMTSHPKDCTEELLLAMRDCEKVERHLHLPVQCGSDRILKAMNRHYTKAQYLKLIEKARELMPDILFTSDIIVGFPGETYEDFKQTVSLIEQVRYQSLYTFIYSKRHGTPAENMPDPVTRKEKGEWMRELLEVQESIAEEICAQQVGKRFVALAEEPSKNEGMLYLRTLCNQVVEAPGSTALIGQFVNIEVTSGETWILKAKIID